MSDSSTTADGDGLRLAVAKGAGPPELSAWPDSFAAGEAAALDLREDARSATRLRGRNRRSSTRVYHWTPRRDST